MPAVKDAVALCVAPPGTPYREGCISRSDLKLSACSSMSAFARAAAADWSESVVASSESRMLDVSSDEAFGRA